MTKKSLFAFTVIILGMLVFFSCEKIKDELNDAAEFVVNMALPDHYFALDSNSYKSTGSIAEFAELTKYEGFINVDSIFEANNLSSASIEDGSISMVEVGIVGGPADWNLDFVSSMRVLISTSSDGAGTLIATTGAIPAGSTSVIFNINSTNIAPFINNNYFFITLEGDVISDIPALTLPMVLRTGVGFTVRPL